MGFLWVILIGFIAGIIARLVSPGPNKPENGKGDKVGARPWKRFLHVRAATATRSGFLGGAVIRA
jgi:hypothetical protein